MGQIEVTVGVIAAAAALSGVVLTQLGEHLRRRWEERRRWQETKRLACREFLYASRVLYSLVHAHRRTALELRALVADHDQLSSDLTADGREQRLVENQRRAARIRDQQDKLQPRIDPTWSRLNEAAADIAILCSSSVRERAAEHQDLIMAIHRQDLDDLSQELAGRFLTEIAEKVAASQEALRQAIRRELGVPSDTR